MIILVVLLPIVILWLLVVFACRKLDGMEYCPQYNSIYNNHKDTMFSEHFEESPSKKYKIITWEQENYSHGLISGAGQKYNIRKLGCGLQFCFIEEHNGHDYLIYEKFDRAFRILELDSNHTYEQSNMVVGANVCAIKLSSNKNYLAFLARFSETYDLYICGFDINRMYDKIYVLQKYLSINCIDFKWNEDNALSVIHLSAYNVESGQYRPFGKYMKEDGNVIPVTAIATIQPTSGDITYEKHE